MELKDKLAKAYKEFKLTTLALKNKNTVYLLAAVLAIFGMVSYRSLPKELFPDIAFPYIMVNTLYFGNPPADIENLLTRPIEKELESIKGIKEIRSTSAQDASMIFIEFNPNTQIEDALQEVRDAVDKARSELPNDLPVEPSVMDIDFSEFPIMNINLSGDYSIDELKRYGEILEEEIEKVAEISKVEISGITEKELKINVDQRKLQAYDMSFRDIEGAITNENVSMSGGEVKLGETRRAVRIIGEFSGTKEIENIIVKHEDQNVVYLKDVAEVIDGFEEPNSFTRLNHQPVVALQVVKKGGENLLSATDQIKEILNTAREDRLIPDDLKITVTGDQSEMVEMQLHNLENSMILSIIFVVTVLFFFLGTRNALFVGTAIPLSMLLSFVILGFFGYKINMIVLFSLILALGMLVDNAIVVVENIYRFINLGYSKFESAKLAVGEVAIPIIASTATTLAAFFPLVFWDSIVGEFMKILPITLIIVLSSSLFVALVIIPVLSSSFVTKDKDDNGPNKRKAHRYAIAFSSLGILGYLVGSNPMGTIFIFLALITIFNLYIFNRIGKWFQYVFLIKLENLYLKILTVSLRGRNQIIIFAGTFVLMILTLMFYFSRDPKILFFPENDPSYINIIAELPVGTDIHKTNEFMQKLEKRTERILGERMKLVKSLMGIVGKGAVGEDEIGSTGGKPSKGMITIDFVDYEFREGINTSELMKELTDSLVGDYPGVVITQQKNSMGPPTGKPINLEITGKNIDTLLEVSKRVQAFIIDQNIEGIENLQMDMETSNPEILVKIDRDMARRFGLSTMQIAGTIRTALFGNEISDYKVGEEEYPIQLRLQDEYRYNVASLMNQVITFRNNQGKLIKVPISAVATVQNSTTYGSIRRVDLNRVITLWSEVVEGSNANEINTKIDELLQENDELIPDGYEYKFTGEQQDMAESMEFLGLALIIAVALIFIILVTQFNSLIRPAIIGFSVILSTIGVFGGLATFNMDFIAIMTGIGIVSLAGIVVNNAIVLIDYIEQLKTRKRIELGLPEGAFLPVAVATECIIQGGKTRLRPVLLTAITTILGLIPMAIGLNIDFAGFLKDFDANIYFGGDMTAMWQPLSLTVIFGLTFATFLTLIVVPIMYRLSTKLQVLLLRLRNR